MLGFFKLSAEVRLEDVASEFLIDGLLFVLKVKYVSHSVIKHIFVLA